MFGFIIGTVCLVLLLKVLRHGYVFHGHGWHGYGHRGCGYGRGPGMRGGAFRWGMRALFERLETTPGQEKAILAALDELRENRKAVAGEMAQTRGDVARAVAAGLIDDATLEDSFARHDRLLAQLRVCFVEALKKITEALDERQRKQLGELIEGGFAAWRSGFGGPSRAGMWV